MTGTPPVIVAAYPEFFNDVFGPVMQPGSSSHMAGPCRMGRLAADLLGEPPASIHITLDAHGSFAGTFGIMAEDRAMVAGVLGMLPDDLRLFLTTGVMGGFTTYSSFNWETLGLVAEGRPRQAALNVLLTVAGCLAAAALGALLARWLCGAG